MSTDPTLRPSSLSQNICPTLPTPLTPFTHSTPPNDRSDPLPSSFIVKTEIRGKGKQLSLELQLETPIQSVSIAFTYAYTSIASFYAAYLDADGGDATYYQCEPGNRIGSAIRGYKNDSAGYGYETGYITDGRDACSDAGAIGYYTRSRRDVGSDFAGLTDY